MISYIFIQFWEFLVWWTPKLRRSSSRMARLPDTFGAEDDVMWLEKGQDFRSWKIVKPRFCWILFGSSFEGFNLLERFPTKKTLRPRNCPGRSRRSTLSDSDLGEALPKDEEVFGGLDFFSVWLDTIWGFENLWKSGAGFNSSSHPDHDAAVDFYRAVDFLRPANDDFLTQLITAKPVVGPPVSKVNWFGLDHEVKRAWWNCWTFGRFLYLLMFHAGHIWSYLIISGHIWSYLVISGHVWSCMMLLLATLQSCHCWVYLAGVVEGSSDQLEMYNIW